MGLLKYVALLRNRTGNNGRECLPMRQTNRCSGQAPDEMVADGMRNDRTQRTWQGAGVYGLVCADQRLKEVGASSYDAIRRRPVRHPGTAQVSAVHATRQKVLINTADVPHTAVHVRRVRTRTSCQRVAASRSVLLSLSVTLCRLLHASCAAPRAPCLVGRKSLASRQLLHVMRTALRPTKHAQCIAPYTASNVTHAPCSLATAAASVAR